MGCNCKRGFEIQEKYGVKEKESFFDKIYKYGWKIIISFLFLVLSIVIAPIIIVMAMYQIVSGNDKPIVLPKQLGKYLK